MSGGHSWKSPELEKCELCGDRDYMADKFCSNNPSVAEQHKQWVEEKRNQKQREERADRE